MKDRWSNSRQQWINITGMHTEHLKNAVRKCLTSDEQHMFDELMTRYADPVIDKRVELPPGTEIDRLSPGEVIFTEVPVMVVSITTKQGPVTIVSTR